MALLMLGAYPRRAARRACQRRCRDRAAGRRRRDRDLAAGRQDVTFGGSFVVDDFARFLKILALIGSAAAILMSLDYLAVEQDEQFEFPILILLSTTRHADADLGGRPDRALSRPRADEPCALRGRREQPRQCALDRSRPEIFRARRAVLRHAALRRLADLRLHRHGQLCRHRARRRDQGGIGLDLRPRVPVRRASASRSRRCRSTCGRPTSTRARRRRSRRSSPPRRRSPASRSSCARPIVAFPGITPQWQQIVVFVAIASMVLGAFAAIGQRNIKRLMAYSSIGHMGFALVGPCRRHRREACRACWSTWRSTSP